MANCVAEGEPGRRDFAARPSPGWLCWLLLGVLCSSCTTTWTADGHLQRNTAPSRLPANLKWCTEQARDRAAYDLRVPDCREDDVFCQQTARLLQPCMGPLRQETENERFLGKVILGMTSDAEGTLTEVCLMKSDMGETPHTLACVADSARSFKGKVRPLLQEEPWFINLVVD